MQVENGSIPAVHFESAEHDSAAAGGIEISEGKQAHMTATAHQTYTWGTGRRKTAVARVRIREGTGQFIVNDLDSKEYFP